MKGFKLTFGITILMASLLVFMPLASILVYSLRLGPRALRDIISSGNVKNAFYDKYKLFPDAALVNCVFGVILAWTLARYDFGIGGFHHRGVCGFLHTRAVHDHPPDTALHPGKQSEKGGGDKVGNQMTKGEAADVS